LPIENYFATIDTVLTDVPFVQSIELRKEKRGGHAGLVKGIITFQDSSQFHFMEFVNLRAFPQKLKYRYHYVEENNNLIFRYDNAPHHKESKTFPQHKHLSDARIIDVEEPTLESVIAELERFVDTGK